MSSSVTDAVSWEPPPPLPPPEAEFLFLKVLNLKMDLGEIERLEKSLMLMQKKEIAQVLQACIELDLTIKE